MTSGKLDTRSGFQIPLESHGACRIGELNDDIYCPWTVFRCVGAAPGVMSGKPRCEIGGDAGVETRWVVGVPQDVDDALGYFHASARANGPPRQCNRIPREFRSRTLGSRKNEDAGDRWPGNFCNLRAKGGLPTVVSGQRRNVHLRLARVPAKTTVDNLRLNPERRLVDQTGIEPVTS